MKMEALDNFNTAVRIMRENKPNSIMLRVATALLELGFDCTSEQLSSLAGVNSKYIAKYRCGLIDGYGFVFKKIRIGHGRKYRFKLIDVTLEPTNLYKRRIAAKRKPEIEKRAPIIDKTDFDLLLDGVFR